MEETKGLFLKLKNLKNSLKSFSLVLVIMSLLLVICDYVPFGNNSFATQWMLIFNI